MNKQPQITDKTRQTFIDAFCLLYSQKPLKKITVLEITRKAGYNRSTFYQYFLDINDLLENVEKELTDIIVENRKQGRTCSSFPLEDLVALYKEKALYLDALLGEFGNQRFFDKVKALPGGELPELESPAGHSLKPYLREYRLSSALSLFQLWLRRKQDMSTENFMSLVTDLYKNGISSFDATRYEE